MEDKLHGSGLDRGLELDLDNKILMGHSSGAHVVVEFLKHHCDMFKGQILFSPVDGVDPFGLIDDFTITPGQCVNYALPTLVLMAGLDGVPGGLAGSLGGGCCPRPGLRVRRVCPGLSAAAISSCRQQQQLYYYGGCRGGVR